MIYKLASIDFGSNNDISIALDKYISADGVDYKVGRERCGFIPGEIDKIKAYTGLTDSDPEIQFINSKWTQEVIDNYAAMMAAQE